MQRCSKRVSKPSQHALSLNVDIFPNAKPRQSTPGLGKREVIQLSEDQDSPNIIRIKKKIIEAPESRASFSTQPTTPRPISRAKIPQPSPKPQIRVAVCKPEDPKSPQKSRILSSVISNMGTSWMADDSFKWHDDVYECMIDNLKAKNHVLDTDMRRKALISVGKWSWEDGGCHREEDFLEAEKLRVKRVEQAAMEIEKRRGEVKVPNVNLNWCEFKHSFAQNNVRPTVENLVSDKVVGLNLKEPELYDNQDIECTIVDNDNKDLNIRVHDAARTLMLSSDRHQDHPPNPLNKKLRECMFKSVPFINSQPSTYENVSLQTKNDDMPKRHLIKQKLAQANFKLKRTFGISYVKQRESKQSGVEGIYKSVPPIVIQCSTMIDPYSPEDQPELIEKVERILDKTFKGGSILVNTMPAVHETNFRDYLLDLANNEDSSTCPPDMLSLLLPSLDSLEILISQCQAYFFSIPNLWKSDKNDGSMMSESGYPNINPVICLHVKKSINSKNAFMAMIGRDPLPKGKLSGSIISSKVKEIVTSNMDKGISDTDMIAQDVMTSMDNEFRSMWDKISGDVAVHEPIDNAESRGEWSEREDKYISEIIKQEGQNFSSMSVKVEMYLPEEKWKCLTKTQKREMTTYMHYFKKRFDKSLFKWSVNRSDMKDQTEVSILNKLSQLTILKELQFYLHASITSDSRPLLKEDVTTVCDYSYSSYSLPLYSVDTRDCFSFDPIVKESIIRMRDRDVIKKEYYFEPDHLPSNFDFFKDKFADGRIGVVTYENYYSHEELQELERLTHLTELEFFKGSFLPHTGQVAMSGKRVKRTKFFFGSRYMWTAQQLCEPHSHVAGGIRTDVSPIPTWMISKIEKPMVDDGIIPQDFINSLALNVYHDGEEGLGQHFDDAIRFRQVNIILT